MKHRYKISAAALVLAFTAGQAMAATCTEQVGSFFSGMQNSKPAEVRQQLSNNDGTWNESLIGNIVSGIHSDGPKGGLARVNSLGLDKSCFTADNLKAYAISGATPVQHAAPAQQAAPPQAAPRIVDGEHRHPQYEARLGEVEAKVTAAERKLATANQSGDAAQIAAATAEAKAARDEAKRLRDEVAGIVRQARAGQSAAESRVHSEMKPNPDVAALNTATAALNDAKDDLANAETLEARLNTLVGRAETAATKAEAAQKAAEAAAAEAKSWAEKAKDAVAGVWDWIYGLLAGLVLLAIAAFIWLRNHGRRLNDLEGDLSYKINREEFNKANKGKADKADFERHKHNVVDQLDLWDVEFAPGEADKLISLTEGATLPTRFIIKGEDKYAIPLRREGAKFFVSDDVAKAVGADPKESIDPLRFVQQHIRGGKLEAFKVADV
jgi:hypothetical protein